jgi:preprotein translocase subunit SecG
MLNAIALVVCILSSLFLVAFVLLHSGRGGGLSDMFGGGGGLSGGTTIERRLDQLTIVTAVVFGLSVFWLAWKWT